MPNRHMLCRTAESGREMQSWHKRLATAGACLWRLFAGRCNGLVPAEQPPAQATQPSITTGDRGNTRIPKLAAATWISLSKSLINSALSGDSVDVTFITEAGLLRYSVITIPAITPNQRAPGCCISGYPYVYVRKYGELCTAAEG